MKWSQVAASQRFQEFDDNKKELIRNDFFNQFVAPNAPEDKLNDIRLAWDERTKGVDDVSLKRVKDNAEFVTEDGQRVDAFESQRSGAVEPSKEAGKNDAAIKSKDGFAVNSLKLAGDTVNRIAGGFAGVANDAIEFAEDNINLGGIKYEEGSIIPTYLSPKEWKKAKDEGLKTTLDRVENNLKTSTLGGEKRHTPENIKSAYKDGRYWDMISESFKFAGESGIESLPYMFLAATSLPAMVVTEADRYGDERAKNNGAEESSIHDTLQALPFALGASYLEKFGADKVFGAGKDAAEKLGKEMLDSGYKAVAKNSIKAGGAETVTEFFEEGVIEYIGTRFGTEAKMDALEALENGAWGALAGGISGTAMATVPATANELMRDKKDSNYHELPPFDEKQEPTINTDDVIADLESQKPVNTPESVEAELNDDIDIESEIEITGQEIQKNSELQEAIDTVKLSRDEDIQSEIEALESVVANDDAEKVDALPETEKAEITPKETKAPIAEESSTVEIGTAIDGLTDIESAQARRRKKEMTPDNYKSWVNGRFLDKDKKAAAISLVEGNKEPEIIDTAAVEGGLNMPVEKANLPAKNKNVVAKERHNASSKIDVSRDSLLVAAARSGGLNLASWESEGLDPSDMKGRSINNKVFGRPAFRANGGMTPDDLAELANEYGYGQNLTSSEVIELISGELSGNPTYNAAAVDEIMAQEAEQRHQDLTDIEDEFKLSAEDSLIARTVSDAISLGVSEDKINSVISDSKGETWEIISNLAGLVPNEKRENGQYNESGLSFEQEEENKRVERETEEIPFDEEGEKIGKGDPLPDWVTGKTESESKADEFGLELQSERDLKNKAESEKKAEEDKKSDEEKADQKRKADAEIDDFSLSGSNSVSDVAASKGQGDIFVKTKEDSKNKAVKPKENTVFTDSAADKARELLKTKLGNLNSGLDPETVQAGITLAGYHIEKGARTFSAYSTAMISDLGDTVKPYLKSWYMAVKYYPNANFEGMDEASAVESFNVDKINEADNVERTPRNPNTDSSDSSDGDQAAREGVSNEGRRGSGQAANKDSQKASENERRDSEPLDNSGDSTTGKQSDQPVPSEKSRLQESIAGSVDDTRSSENSPIGLFVERQEPAISSGIVEEKNKLNPLPIKAAEKKKGDRLSQVKNRMPFLTAGQADDVVFAEERFNKDDGYGVLFTNGTGTGKTFTGLGVIRRLADQGKKNILIATPKQTIADAWKRVGGEFFNLNVTPLKDTLDAGSGIVVTTYANISANSSLVSRDWDMIVLDESHYLSSSADGRSTGALQKIRALTLKDGTQSARAEALKPKETKRIYEILAEIDDLKKRTSATPTGKDTSKMIDDLYSELEPLREVISKEKQNQKALIESTDPKDKPRSLMLSATPFAYEKNVSLAQGFLFDWKTDKESGGYNQPNDYEQFMMNHFGYTMRYNRLTEPNAKVDRGLMQRAFNSWLKKEKVLSGRALDSDFDYDRKFILTENALGKRVDQALDFLREHSRGDNEIGGMEELERTIVGKNFDYHARMYFLEAIKAKEATEYIKKNLDIGRKVVVMHDFKKGGATNPFRVRPTQETSNAYRMFSSEFSDIIQAFDVIPSPIDHLTEVFPEALVYNGSVSAKNRIKIQDEFNDPEKNKNLIIAQGDAMREGVSIHDTIGTSPRVLIHLGMPVKPTAAIQQEGRIYRTGQASDAMFRYITIGSSWERIAFATKIASRASAAENLAMGEQARGLKESFINAYEDAGEAIVGYEGEGQGGRESDAQFASLLTPWDMAKSYYYASKKQGSGRSSAGREQSEFFATPEPLGLKMVQWADIKAGESVLEPSAGVGSIARFFPENTKNRAIEYTHDLSSKLALHFDGDLLTGDFIEHNKINKYDAIVMNPPFGSGGKQAAEHVAKAAKHIKDGGRIVALIPSGGMADKRFKELLESEEFKDIHQVASIKLPSVTFERAGTKVNTRVIVLDKQTDKKIGDSLVHSHRDYSEAENIGDFFDRLEGSEIRPRAIPVSQKSDKGQSQPSENIKSSSTVRTWEAEHTKTGETTYMAAMNDRVEREEFVKLKDIAKANDGYWSRFGKAGFLFKTELDRNEFVKNISGENKDALYSISERSKVKFGATPNGVTKNEAQSIAGRFFEKYRGAKDGLQVRVYRSQQEAIVNEGIALEGRVKGFYLPRENKVVIIAANMDSKRDTEKTLQHEILAHKGLGFFPEEEVKKLLGRIKEAAKHDYEIGVIWDEVSVTYAKESDLVKAEEVIARIAEGKLSLAGEWANKIVTAIRRFLKAVGLASYPIKRSDLLSLVYLIGDNYKKGNRSDLRQMDGFFEDRGKSKAFTVSDSMYRMPKNTTKILFSRNDSEKADSSNRAPAPDYYDRLKTSLGDKDKSIFSRALNEFKRQILPRGLLPESVFDFKLKRDFDIQGNEYELSTSLASFDQAVKNGYGKKYSKLSESEKIKINKSLGSNDPDKSIPDDVRVEILKMRMKIAGLSKEYVDALYVQIGRLEAQGDDAAASVKMQLIEKIASNYESYVNRSYKAFDDPNWPKKVSEDKEVMDNAIAYLENQYANDGPVTEEIKEKVGRKIELMLKNGTAYDGIESFISESKLGAKDLSTLIKRKDIAPEIRALLGEYEDIEINYAKTITKMTRLVFNEKFLEKVLNDGMGEYLFTEENRPLNATVQIAGDGSKIMEPLNGLYTYPHIEQAFKDALGKDQTPEWLRFIIKANGMVKYGKTVLSPTTAMRNFYSAAFFALANGHFDFRHTATSFKLIRSYFNNKGGKTKYLLKLKRLGVVYDTPYAQEMMDLLADSNLENTLFKKGSFNPLKSINEVAQKFYAYGDDFWKIVGFENEKAMLIKHKGMSESEAEVEAATRIRNTYPTYSLTPRFVQFLRRFPLAGTFVSFPAEIIRTSYHIVNYARKDYSTAYGARKFAGISIAAGASYAAQAISKAMLGIGDEEEEAVKELSPHWSKNSNIMFLPRDKDGNLQYLDVSFLDPYNYWKRPINAIMRDEPYVDELKSVADEVLSPFFGQDIAFGSVMEAFTNNKGNGVRVFNPDGDLSDQALDIANHLRKSLQFGLASNAERFYKAYQEEVSASGKKYTYSNELLALAGFRATTLDVGTALFYSQYSLSSSKRNAKSILNKPLKTPNAVSNEKIEKAVESSIRAWERAYKKQSRIIEAAKASGMSNQEISIVIRDTSITKKDALLLMRGRTPQLTISSQSISNARKKARPLYGREKEKEIKERFDYARRYLKDHYRESK